MKVSATNFLSAKNKQDKDTLFSQANNKLIANLFNENEYTMSQNPSNCPFCGGTSKDKDDCDISCAKYDNNYAITTTTVTKAGPKKSTLNSI